MKLFEVPKTLADLEINDIVYIIQDEKIKQAKLVENKTYYILNSTPSSRRHAGVEIDEKSEYRFVTPDGKEHVVTKRNYFLQSGAVYYTVNDVRDDKKMEFFYSTKENCAQAYKGLRKAMIEKIGFDIVNDYNITLYDIRKGQICDHKWDAFMDCDGMINLKFISNIDGKWIDVYDNIQTLLDSSYYATKSECAKHYEPEVMMF